VLAKLKSRGLGLWLGACAGWWLQGAWRWAKLNSCGLGVGAGGWGLGRLGAGGWGLGHELRGSLTCLYYIERSKAAR